MSATVSRIPPAEPLLLVGLPVGTWLFALRIWMAMVVALGAAFWLQLDDPSSAAVTVAILAQPRRGQAFQKAIIRFGATMVGFAGSIALTGLFAQTRDLFILMFAFELAVCVYFASCYDGLKAYGFALSGYTVAIVSVIQIDSPQTVFSTGVSRLAVVGLGIASIALINDVFAAPDVYPDLRRRLRAAAASVSETIESWRRGDPPAPEATAKLFATITGLRLDILTLPSERAAGRRQAAAARSAVAAMIGAVQSAAMLSSLRADCPPPVGDEPIPSLSPSSEAEIDAALGADPPDVDRLALVRYAADVRGEQDLADRELAAMEAGRLPTRDVTLPIHRDRQNAARKAIRVFAGVILSAVLFILGSWPMTSLAFAQFGVLAALSATMPDAKAFAKGALLGMPLAVVFAGVTEFFVLDGADSFPLLAIGMAPAVFIGCFLFLNPKTSGMGFLALLFFVVILSPANPQSYNPQAFIYTSFLSITSVVLLAIVLNCFVPTNDKDRRRWLVANLRRAFADVLRGDIRRPPPEALYLSADRITQIAAFQIGCPAARQRRLAYALFLSRLKLAALRAETVLQEIETRAPLRPVIEPARRAIARLDAPELRATALAAAVAARDAAGPDRACLVRVAADLRFIAATLQTTRRAHVHHLRATVSA